MDDDETIMSILDQVNGVYLSGDSQNSLGNSDYINAFRTIMQYVRQHNK